MAGTGGACSKNRQRERERERERQREREGRREERESNSALGGVRLSFGLLRRAQCCVGLPLQLGRSCLAAAQLLIHAGELLADAVHML